MDRVDVYDRSPVGRNSDPAAQRVRAAGKGDRSGEESEKLLSAVLAATVPH